jgi:RNA polymerase sigma-70 factor (ECF subfamily)
VSSQALALCAPVAPVRGVNDLVARAARGDRAAFEAIYAREAGRVYALCLRLAGNRQRAEDYTQDVFVRCWERLRTFRGDSALSSWLHRLTVNVVFEDQRTARRRERRVVTAPDGLPDVPAPAVEPGDRMDLEEAIAALPPGARRVFVLHDIEGYGHAEIAELLGIAPGTSKAHLHRARRHLREALER